jgi:hypothetical protein
VLFGEMSDVVPEGFARLLFTASESHEFPGRM